MTERTINTFNKGMVSDVANEFMQQDTYSDMHNFRLVKNEENFAVETIVDPSLKMIVTSTITNMTRAKKLLLFPGCFVFFGRTSFWQYSNVDCIFMYCSEAITFKDKSVPANSLLVLGHFNKQVLDSETTLNQLYDVMHSDNVYNLYFTLSNMSLMIINLYEGELNLNNSINSTIVIFNPNIARVYDISLSKLTPDFPFSYSNKKQVTLGDAQLRCGKYFYAYRYITDDGAVTNWKIVKHGFIAIRDIAIVRYRADLSNPNNYQAGNSRDEFTSIRNRFLIYGLQVGAKIEIVSMFSGDRNTVTDVKIIQRTDITSSTMQIDDTGNVNLGSIDLNEIISDNKSFENIKTFSFSNDRLFIANVEEENLQIRTSNITDYEFKNIEAVEEQFAIPADDLINSTNTVDEQRGLFKKPPYTNVSYEHPLPHINCGAWYHTGPLNYSTPFYYLRDGQRRYSGNYSSEADEQKSITDSKNRIEYIRYKKYKKANGEYVFSDELPRTDGNREDDNFEFKKMDMSNRQIAEFFKSCWRDEWIRLGIELFTETGSIGVRHIKDIKISDLISQPLMISETFNGNTFIVDTPFGDLNNSIDAREMVYHYTGAKNDTTLYRRLYSNVISIVLNNIDITELVDTTNINNPTSILKGFSIVVARHKHNIINEGVIVPTSSEAGTSKGSIPYICGFSKTIKTGIKYDQLDRLSFMNSKDQAKFDKSFDFNDPATRYLWKTIPSCLEEQDYEGDYRYCLGNAKYFLRLADTDTGFYYSPDMLLGFDEYNVTGMTLRTEYMVQGVVSKLSRFGGARKIDIGRNDYYKHLKYITSAYDYWGWDLSETIMRNYDNNTKDYYANLSLLNRMYLPSSSGIKYAQILSAKKYEQGEEAKNDYDGKTYSNNSFFYAKGLYDSNNNSFSPSELIKYANAHVLNNILFGKGAKGVLLNFNKSDMASVKGFIYSSIRKSAQYNNPYQQGLDGLANETYIQIGHFQEITTTILNEIKQPNGKFIFNEVQCFPGDAFVTPFTYARITHDQIKSKRNYEAIVKNDSLLFHGSNLKPYSYTDGAAFGSIGVTDVFFVQSKVNPSLRNADKKSLMANFGYNGLSEYSDRMTLAFNEDKDGNVYQGEEEFKYTGGYSTNDIPILQSFPLPYNDKLTNKFPNKIYYSEPYNPSSLINSFRVFKQLNYKDTKLVNGSITGLISKRGGLFIIQQRGVSQALIQPLSLVTSQSNQNIALGLGGIIDKLEYITESYGAEDVNHILASEQNIYWFDVERNELLAITPNGLDKLFERTGNKSFISYLKNFSGRIELEDNPEYGEVFLMALNGIIKKNIIINERQNIVVGSFDIGVNETFNVVSTHDKKLFYLNTHIYQLDISNVKNNREARISIVINNNNIFSKVFDNMTLDSNNYFDSVVYETKEQSFTENNYYNNKLINKFVRKYIGRWNWAIPTINGRRMRESSWMKVTLKNSLSHNILNRLSNLITAFRYEK